MVPERQDDKLLEFIRAYRDSFARRSLMYAGPDLGTVEAMWHMLSTFEDFAYDRVNLFDPVAVAATRQRPEDDAYSVIAQKYRCGSWTLGTKVEHEMCKDGQATREAAEELIRRLREVDALREEMRLKDRNA